MERKPFYELDEIQDDNGLWIVVDDNQQPYTGIVFETFDNGMISYEGEHINGRICGYEKRWYENGQLSSSEQKYNNTYHGISKSWYEDGTLKFEGENRFGHVIKYKRYNPDSSLKDEYNITDDKEKLNSYNKLLETIKNTGLEQQWNSIF